MTRRSASRGQEPSLGWLGEVVKASVVGLALLVAFVPRRRSPVTVAALGAAVLIALQLTVEHWFYLYIPWFLPFLFIALLGTASRSESEQRLGAAIDSGGASGPAGLRDDGLSPKRAPEPA